MNNVVSNKKGTIKYLICTFLIAWIMQVAVAVLYRNGLAAAGQLLMSIIMFAPLLGVLLSGHTLSGMGWKPSLKGKIKILLIAWFLPAFLTAIGAILYFIVFPGHFDMSGEYLAANAGPEILEQLEAQGLTYPLYILISVVSCLTYAPLINMLAAVGEEANIRIFIQFGYIFNIVPFRCGFNSFIFNTTRGIVSLPVAAMLSCLFSITNCLAGVLEKMQKNE